MRPSYDNGMYTCFEQWMVCVPLTRVCRLLFYDHTLTIAILIVPFHDISPSSEDKISELQRQLVEAKQQSRDLRTMKGIDSVVTNADSLLQLKQTQHQQQVQLLQQQVCIELPLRVAPATGCHSSCCAPY